MHTETVLHLRILSYVGMAWAKYHVIRGHSIPKLMEELPSQEGTLSLSLEGTSLALYAHWAHILFIIIYTPVYIGATKRNKKTDKKEESRTVAFWTLLSRRQPWA